MEPLRISPFSLCVKPKTIQANLVPPKDWIDNGTILQIADLPDLYKVFERC